MFKNAKRKLLPLFIILFTFSFTVNVSSASALTSEQIQAIISLVRSFGGSDSVLQNVEDSLYGRTPTAPITPTPTAEQPFCHNWNTNLKIGDSGFNVAQLVVALNKEGLLNGKTDIFDEEVASAVVGFQQKYRPEILTINNLARGTGYVGPATRMVLNRLYGCGNQIQPSASITTSSETTALAPYIIGTASGVSQVGITINNAGGKVYGSGLVPVVNGNWSVTVSPALVLGQYTINVYDTNNNLLTTKPLNIVSSITTQPSITVLSPNGGEVLKTGDQYKIKWSSSNLPSDAKIGIVLFKGTGALNTLIVSNLPTSQNEYTWTVTENGNWGYGYNSVKSTLATIFHAILGVEIANADDNTYRILVTGNWSNSTGGNAYDYSDSYFTITAPTVQPIVSGYLSGASEDKASGWDNVFWPGAGSLNRNPADWRWNMKLRFVSSNPKSVKRITVIHNTRGEVWSTGYSRYLSDGTDLYGWEEHPYPLVMMTEKVGSGSGAWHQLNTSYDQPLYIGGPTASLNIDNEYSLYGQPESTSFTGGKLVVEFTDGTSVTSVIPASSIVQAESPASYTVSLDPNSPSFQRVAAGTKDVTLAVLKFSNLSTTEDIELRRIALQLSGTDKNSSNDLWNQSVSIWNGATKVGDAIFPFTDYATSTILNSVRIPRLSSVSLTIKGDISSLFHAGALNTPGDILKVDYDGNNNGINGNYALGLNTGLNIAPSSPDTASAGIEIVAPTPVPLTDAEIIKSIQVAVLNNLCPVVGICDLNLDMNNDSKVTSADVLIVGNVLTQSYEQFDTVYKKIKAALVARLGLTTGATKFIAEFDINKNGTIEQSDWDRISKALIGTRVYPPSTLSVDLKVNGSDGPVTVASGATVFRTWSATPTSIAMRCVSTGPNSWSSMNDIGISGSFRTNSGSVGSYTSSLTCYDVYGNSASDSVVVNVEAIPLTLTVLSPNGGENWQIGSNKVISWDSNVGFVNVRLDFCGPTDSTCTAASRLIYTIASNVSGTSYNWTVGKSKAGEDIPAGQYKLSVSSVSGPTTGRSNSPFTITAPQLTDAELVTGLEAVIRRFPGNFLNYNIAIHGNFDLNDDKKVDVSDENMMRNVWIQTDIIFDTIYKKTKAAVMERLGLKTGDTKFITEFDIDKNGTIELSDWDRISKALIGTRVYPQVTTTAALTPEAVSAIAAFSQKQNLNLANILQAIEQLIVAFQ